ncbi:SDR family oxidoreductase [Rhodobacter calidifons]|uniref:SDR family oxidoreductase n=1 Tax=Rhodobacter calidifons TaxID=2715277 RepID=A0ABX0GAJ3_9RHOB|nr:SDR family oxidoreductase [Rhodobacter calidifons]NHB77939.1 SDR family oxidoreductase [Rhodobacter calidifons]
MQDSPIRTGAPDAVAVVTGAGSAIGRALAAALALRGVAVAAISAAPHDADPAADLPADLPAILTLVADVRDPAAVSETFDRIRERLGPPTILINGAEVYPHRDILEETPQSFMDTVQLNLGGAFNCCHAVLPQMVAAGRGRIINIVTFADIQPAPLAAGYSVSKGALRILTRALVADLGDRFPGIVINDWIPGTHTPRRGIPDGVDPRLAAEWGADLALLDDRSINGRLFLRDCEHQPAQTLRGRLKDRVLGRGRVRVRLK